MSEPLLNRIVLAALDILEDSDPPILIGVGGGEVRISWNAVTDTDGR